MVRHKFYFKIDHEGTVTLWSPNMNQPLVKMLCQRGALTDLAINRSGQYVINLY